MQDTLTIFLLASVTGTEVAKIEINFLKVKDSF